MCEWIPLSDPEWASDHKKRPGLAQETNCLCLTTSFEIFWLILSHRSCSYLYQNNTKMASRRGIHKYDSYDFCYICGSLTPPPHQKTTSEHHILCGKSLPCLFSNESRRSLLIVGISNSMLELRLIQETEDEYTKKHFGIPMVWREHKNQTKDLYFCFTDVSGFNSMNKRIMIGNQQKDLFNILKKFQFQC